MILALFTHIYNDLNDKYKWKRKKLDVFQFYLWDLLLLELVGLVLYVCYEVLPQFMR